MCVRSAQICREATVLLTGDIGPIKQSTSSSGAVFEAQMAGTARHVAGLAHPQQRIQIASSDRHNIKPWFNGKLDFAPTVADLSAEGFVLLGARVEQIEQQPAAALIYQAREHSISLFMTRSAQTEPISIKTIRGFNVARWAAGGVRFAAVADTDVREIERFAGLVQTPH